MTYFKLVDSWGNEPDDGNKVKVFPSVLDRETRSAQEEER